VVATAPAASLAPKVQEAETEPRGNKADAVQLAPEDSLARLVLWDQAAGTAPRGNRACVARLALEGSMARLVLKVEEAGTEPMGDRACGAQLAPEDSEGCRRELPRELLR